MYYEPHPTDPNKTLLRQEATVTVEGVPLSHYMEEMLTSKISLNAGKGRQGLEWVINKINTEVGESAALFCCQWILIVNLFAGERNRRVGSKEHGRVVHAHEKVPARYHAQQFLVDELLKECGGGA